MFDLTSLSSFFSFLLTYLTFVFAKIALRKHKRCYSCKCYRVFLRVSQGRTMLSSILSDFSSWMLQDDDIFQLKKRKVQKLPPSSKLPSKDKENARCSLVYHLKNTSSCYVVDSFFCRFSSVSCFLLIYFARLLTIWMIASFPPSFPLAPSFLFFFSFEGVQDSMKNVQHRYFNCLNFSNSL